MGIKQRWLWVATAGIVLIALTVWGSVSAHSVKIVYIYSDSCGYCATFGPVFEKAVKEYPQDMVERLDIHKKQELDKALRLGAVSTPTLFIVQDGEVKDMLEGEVPEKVLQGFLQRNVGNPLSGNTSNR